MQFDTVIQTPIANTAASSPEPAPESSVQDDLEKYPMLALISSEYASGEAASPDVPLPAGEALPAGSTGTNPIQPDPTADASPAATSETDPTASTALSVPDEKTPSAEKEKKEPVDPLEAIKALAPDVADYMKKLLEASKTPATVKLRILEIILERTYGKVESSLKVSSNAQPSLEASRARIAAIVSRIRVDGEQIRMVLDDQ